MDIHPRCLIKSVESSNGSLVDYPVNILSRIYRKKTYEFYLAGNPVSWYPSKGKTDKNWIEEDQFDFMWMTLSNLKASVKQKKNFRELNKYLNLIEYAEEKMKKNLWRFKSLKEINYKNDRKPGKNTKKTNNKVKKLAKTPKKTNKNIKTKTPKNLKQTFHVLKSNRNKFYHLLIRNRKQTQWELPGKYHFDNHFSKTLNVF